MADQGSNPPVSIAETRAREFLTEIQEKPFIAMVMSEGDVRVFTRGLDDTTMQKISGLIEQITSRPTA